MILKKEMGASNYEWLIVGLGNPGAKYEFTRHNAGFLCVDLYAEKNSFKIDRIKFKGTLSDVRIKGKRCLFLKPQTFMNLSGESVREVAAFYKIPPERIIVIFDDVSLDVGKKPHPDYDLADWVLKAFTKDELKELRKCCDNACDALELMIDGKTDEAMSKFNS